MRRSSYPLRACALLLSFLGAAANGGAALADDPAPAEALFNRGVEAMSAGNYEAGCKDIAESRRLDPQPGALFTLATCMDRWGHIATAVDLYGEYLALYDNLPDDRRVKQGERPKVARERRDKLAPAVPTLTLTLPPGAPAGTRVLRDGQEVAAAALGRAVPVDPGESVITTQAPGGQVWEQRIKIGTGERRSVTLEVKGAPVIVAPPAVEQPAAQEGISNRRKAAFAIGGIGIAGIAVGAVTGGLTVSQKSVIDEHCGEAIGAPKARCDPTGLDAARSAKSLGLASTIAFAAGGAALGVGVILLVTARPAASPKAGTASRWVAAEVLSTGPGGAMIGARGAF